MEDDSIERVGETLCLFGAMDQREEIHNFIIKKLGYIDKSNIIPLFHPKSLPSCPS